MALTLQRETPARGFPGGGSLKTYLGTDVAAGVSAVTESIPTGKVWYLLGFSLVLVTDATVANRALTLQLDDGVIANQAWRSGTSGAQTASLTWTHVWGDYGASISQANSDLVSVAPIPDFFPAPAGWRLTIQGSTIQAGDNFAAPVIHVLEYAD